MIFIIITIIINITLNHFGSIGVHIWVDFAGVLVTAGKATEGVKAIVATLNSNKKKVQATVKQQKNKMTQTDKAKPCLHCFVE